MAVAQDLELDPADAAPRIEPTLAEPAAGAAPAPATPLGKFQAFAQTPMGRNFLLGLAVAVLLAVGFAIWMWNQPPQYKVLFSNFTDRDGGAITAALDQMGVKHKFSEGGGAILVPTEQVHDVRLRLAAQGLPKGGNVGFELMENQKLGVSQFLEQVNFQRALEGELARSIQSVAAVDSARVHLALPKPSVFVREQQKPTASVLLNLRPGRGLDQSQVSAIVHLVASSVPELLPANVTLVDQGGNLLSDKDRDREKEKDRERANKGLDPEQYRYVQQLQQGVIKQVESIIIPIVGEGNVRAEATADVDFSKVEQAAEIYKPNSPPELSSIRSQQTSESNATGAANPSGVPGALSNQPPSAATAPLSSTVGGAAAGPGGQNGPMRKDSTTNYEVDKTVRYEQKSMGGLRRLSVAVVVNYRRTVDKAGKLTVKALSPVEMAQINDLVKMAMGYNQERGDSFSVANSPFDGVDKPLEQDPLAWWRDPENRPLIIEVAKYLAYALIALFLYLRFGRRLLRPVLHRFDEITAPPPPPELPPTPEQIRAKEEEEAAALALAAGLITPEEAAQKALQDLEEKTAQAYRDNLDMAKSLAQADPRVVANVIKAWLGNE